MRHRSASRLAVSALLGLGLSLGASHHAEAAWDGVVDAGDGISFDGATGELLFLGGPADLPFGADLGRVQSQLDLAFFADVVEYRMLFPGQAGQTVSLDTGDVIDLMFSYDGDMTITFTDTDPVQNFGGGLGDTVSFTLPTSLTGQGSFTVDLGLNNLGIGSPDNFFASFAIGGGSPSPPQVLADLDGDGTSETVALLSPSFSAGGISPASFMETILPGVVLYEIAPGATLLTTTLISVNPDVAAVIELTEWSYELDLVVPAQGVSEPAAPWLLGLGLAGLLRRAGRQRA